MNATPKRPTDQELVTLLRRTIHDISRISEGDFALEINERLTAVADALGAASTEPCVWTEDEDGIYHTTCQHSWFFDTGTATENQAKFCPYCGRALRDKRYEPSVGEVMRSEFEAIGEQYTALENVELKMISGYTEQAGDVQTGYGTALRHLREIMRRLAPLRFDRDHDVNGHLRKFVAGLEEIGIVESVPPAPGSGVEAHNGRLL
jgi:hypothetical protein